MQFSHKIAIDMEIFLKTGKCDYLEIGQSKQWILKNFPDPEEWTSDTIMNADIWKYGHIELHFSEDKLATIFSDHFNYVSVNVASDIQQVTEVLDGGKSLLIKPWIITSKLTISDTITILLDENIDFFVETKPFKLENFINITLSFQGHQHKAINDCELGAFSYHGTLKNYKP